MEGHGESRGSSRQADKHFYVQAAARRFRPVPPPTDLPTGTSVRRLSSGGAFKLAKVTYLVGRQHGFQHVLVIVDADTITVADLDGTILIEHTQPAPGITYVGNGRPLGPRPKTAETSPKS